jgi:hypothetical protein
MWKHILKAVFRIGGTFLVSIPLVLLGLVIVPLGLRSRRTFENSRQPFEQYPGEWVLIRLPNHIAYSPRLAFQPDSNKLFTTYGGITVFEIPKQTAK